MKRIEKNKRLSLNPTTVRALATDHLQLAGGGRARRSEELKCWSDSPDICD